MLQSGERIDHYLLIDCLGTNQFGEVWTARESITERLVRLNFLDRDGDYEIARFTRTMSLLSRLNHPAIIAPTGHGFHRRRSYFATEHVRGPTIASLMRSGARRMDEIKVLQLAAQLAEGLAHAWTVAEIIHRSLGPETVLIDLASMQEDYGQLRVKLVDFGNALGRRLIDQYDSDAEAEEESFQRAALQERVGNPLTMAPEQIQGARLTVGCDMYALGVTMHLLLAGAPPFSGNDEELRQGHLRTTPLDLRQVVPGIQAGTAAFVRRLLAKKSEERFPDWDSFLSKLQPLLKQLERARPARPEVSTGKLRRPTTYENTPQGVAIPGGVEGGGVNLPPVPVVVATSDREQERQLFATLAARLGTIEPVAARIQAASVVAPPFDDGLTSGQRSAVWEFLFRNPAILEASVSALPPTEPPSKPTTTTTAVHLRAPAMPPPLFQPAPELEPPLEMANFDSPTPPEPPSTVQDPFLNVPVFAQLFVDATPVVPKAKPTQPAPGADVPGNPAQSPFWKLAIELLQQEFLGRVRYQPNSGTTSSLTKRITASLRRLVPTTREQSLAEIVTALDAGQFDEATWLLDRLVAAGIKSGSPGNDATMCLLRARMLALRKDLAGALRWAQDAVHLQSEDPLALALVGLSHLQVRRVSAAMQIFDEAARVHPDSPLGPLGQAVILILANLPSKARLAIIEAEARESHPGTIRVKALFCRATSDTVGEVAQLRRLLTGTDADWEIRERIHQLIGDSHSVPHSEE